MNVHRRIWLIRIGSMFGLIAGLAAFGVGVGLESYALVTAGFVLSLATVASLLSAKLIIDMIERRLTVAVRIGGIAVLAGAIFLFSLGTGFHNPLLVIAALVLGLASVAVALRPDPLSRAILRRRHRDKGLPLP